MVVEEADPEGSKGQAIAEMFTVRESAGAHRAVKAIQLVQVESQVTYSELAYKNRVS